MKRTRTFYKETKTQQVQEPQIFLRMNQRKSRGLIKHKEGEITDMDVMINDEIAIQEAQIELWKLHSSEKILVDVMYPINLN